MDRRESEGAEELHDQKAQGFVEYALVIGFVVALGVFLFVTHPDLMVATSSVFSSAADALSSSSS